MGLTTAFHPTNMLHEPLAPQRPLLLTSTGGRLSDAHQVQCKGIISHDAGARGLTTQVHVTTQTIGVVTCGRRPKSLCNNVAPRTRSKRKAFDFSFMSTSEAIGNTTRNVRLQSFADDNPCAPTPALKPKTRPHCGGRLAISNGHHCMYTLSSSTPTAACRPARTPSSPPSTHGHPGSTPAMRMSKH